MNPIIKCEHTDFGYENHDAVIDLNLEIYPGDYLCGVGENGSGKSTLIKGMLGLLKPTGGSLSVADELKRGGIGYLPQQTAAQKDFPATVQEVVLSGTLSRRGNRPFYSRAERKLAAHNLERLGIEHLKQKCYRELSGGQQQRTALARILVGKPKILMLDEPFSALDSYLREEVEGEVGSLLAGFDGTALLVTHNRDEAYRLCRDMIVMDGGQVLRTGTTKEVFADPRSTAAARLTGCKNILPCTRVDAHSVRLAGCESLLHLAAEVPEGCTAVGIRAHDFAPCAPGAENALPVELLSASENPFDWNLIFQLPDGTTRLWWKVSKTTLSVAEPDAPACLSALPESIMALVDHSQYAQ